ncbi:dienelactone hydrolase family protein [Alphaproteobacteria bacterium]|nr:dienelactone hydrolase family protein [Alphaproteobacteria bacterium]
MIKITNKIIKSADNYPLPYLQVEPDNNTSKKSIILVYEIFGLTDHIKNVAKEYAENGFLVAIPDIFSRLENNIDLPYNKNGFSKGLYLKEKLGWELPVMDIVALAANLRLESNVSVLGYCYGGSLAWLAMQKSFIFEKGICYYGSSIPAFLELNINCPSMLHFGSKDKGIPIESIEKIKKFIDKNKNKIELYVYENADHGFNCNQRKSYNKKAAELAFEKTIKFLKDSI